MKSKRFVPRKWRSCFSCYQNTRTPATSPTVATGSQTANEEALEAVCPIVTSCQHFKNTTTPRFSTPSTHQLSWWKFMRLENYYQSKNTAGTRRQKLDPFMQLASTPLPNCRKRRHQSINRLMCCSHRKHHWVWWPPTHFRKNKSWNKAARLDWFC